MRRAVSVALVVSGLFSAVTGIWNFFPPFSESFSPGHAIGACGIIVFIKVGLKIWQNAVLQ